MKLTGAIVVTRTVMCVQCQHVYQIGFEKHGRAVNAGCKRLISGKMCGCVKWSFSPKAKIDEMVAANVNAVWFIVKKLMRQFPPTVIEKLGGEEEIASEGFAALVNAAHHYDPDRKCAMTGKPVTFNTYSMTAVETCIRSWIDYELRHGANGEPIIGDLCPHCNKGVERKTYREWWCPTCERSLDSVIKGKYVVACKESLSISGMMENGAEGGKHDGDLFVPDKRALSPAEEAHRLAVNRELERKMQCLDPRRRKVLELLYFQGMTLHAAGIALRISKERVRQNKLEALAKIASLYGADVPEDYKTLLNTRQRENARRTIQSKKCPKCGKQKPIRWSRCSKCRARFKAQVQAGKDRAEKLRDSI